MKAKPERRLYSKTERKHYLELFDASGLSGKKFAESQNIKYPTLSYWLKTRQKQSRAQSFIEVSPLGSDPSESTIEIFLSNGTAIRSPDVSTTARILRELGLAC